MTGISDSGFYPTFFELIGLASFSILLIAVSKSARGWWDRRGLVMPVPAAVLMLAAMVVAYALVMGGTFATLSAGAETPIPESFERDATALDHRFVVLFWGFLFFVPVALYYGHYVAHAMASRAIDTLSPFSAIIEDPSEFAPARRMALRGEIDAAVGLYQDYGEGEPAALLEAARLLKSEGRPADAAEILRNATEMHEDDPMFWAEATYALGKLHETALANPTEAVACYERVLQRLPATRFADTAGIDVSRLRSLMPEALEGADAPTPEADPFYRQRHGSESGADPAKSELQTGAAPS